MTLAVLEPPTESNAMHHEPSQEFPRDRQRRMTQMFKMLSDPTRLKIVMMLLQEQDELHVTGLCERLGQSQPAVSHHLALMKASELIDVRRRGKHNFYFVDRSYFHQMMGNLFRFIGEEFGGFESAALRHDLN